jgi:antitoxin FitA
MPNLSIKNVPAAVVEQLHQRAARQHRSMQGELMALLQAALASPATDTTRQLAGRSSGTRRMEEIAAARRALHKEPLTNGPSATDIIRAERDAR